MKKQIIFTCLITLLLINFGFGAKIINVSGNVTTDDPSIKTVNKDDNVLESVNYTVADNSELTLLIKNSLIIKVSNDASFSLPKDSKFSILKLKFGELLFKLQPNPNYDYNFSIQTPASVAGIKGTAGKMVSTQDGKDTLMVLEGEVELYNPNDPAASVYVTKGKKATMEKGQNPTRPIDMTESEKSELQNFNQESTQILASVLQEKEKSKANDDTMDDDPMENEPTEIANQPESNTNVSDKSPAEEKTMMSPPADNEPAEESSVSSDETVIPQTADAGSAETEKGGEKKDDKDKEDKEKSESGFSMSGQFGAIDIDGVTYKQIRLMPVIRLGKFGIGLDLPLYLDSNNNLKDVDGDGKPDEYQDVRSGIEKIMFLEWGRKNQKFHLRVGTIDAITIGHGLIVNNFTNMLNYPEQRNIGVVMDVNTRYGGFESFMSNALEHNIYAARGFFKPIGTFTKTETTMFRDFAVGVTFAADMNEYGSLKDSDGDGYPDFSDKFPNDKSLWSDYDDDGIADQNDFDRDNNAYIEADLSSETGAVLNKDNRPSIEKDIYGVKLKFEDSGSVPYDNPFTSKDKERQMKIIGFDAEIPLISKKSFGLKVYADMAKMIDTGGIGFILPGVDLKLPLNINAKLEYRIFDNNFVPQYFDYFYTKDRIRVKDKIPVTKSDNIDTNSSPKLMGFYGSLIWPWGKIAGITATFQYYQGDVDPRLNGEFFVDEDWLYEVFKQKIGLKVIGETNFKWDDTYLRGIVKYGISDNMFIVYMRTYTFNSQGERVTNDEITTTFSF